MFLSQSYGLLVAGPTVAIEGMIRYSRGHITVLDRAKLEARVCECYAVVKKAYDRLLPFETR